MASINQVDGIDPSALRLFLAVVELGSVSRAASRMHVAQPSATAKLQKLERLLGIALLERTPTGSVPTEAGTRLLPACGAVLAAATDLVDGASALRVTGRSLTVASTRHVVDHFLPTWLEHPDVAPTSVIEADTFGVARAVRDGEAMIGFVEGPERPIGLSARHVADEPLVAVVGRTHPWYGRSDPPTVAELGAATTVLPRRGSGLRDVVTGAFSAAGHEPHDLVEVTSVRTALLAAISGAGVAHLPPCTAGPAIDAGALWTVPTSSRSLVLPVRIVWRGDRPATEPARALLRALSA